jgi:hypothetical protein
MKVSLSFIEISPELWGCILNFVDRTDFCNKPVAYTMSPKPTVLRYRAVCRTFSDQCLALLRKISLTDSIYCKTTSESALLGVCVNTRSVMCRLLSRPVNIIEIELVGKYSFIELELADCEAIAACK